MKFLSVVKQSRSSMSTKKKPPEHRRKSSCETFLAPPSEGDYDDDDTNSSLRFHHVTFEPEDFVLDPKIARRLVKVVKKHTRGNHTATSISDLLGSADTSIHSLLSSYADDNETEASVPPIPIWEDGDYKIGDAIAAGGFGLVCHVKATSDSSSMVVKMPLPQTVNEKLVAGVYHLAMEIQVLSQLRHPHIVQAKGCTSLNQIAETQQLDSYLLALEYLPTTLIDKLQEWQIQQQSRSKKGGYLLRSKSNSAIAKLSSKIPTSSLSKTSSKSSSSSLPYLYETKLQYAIQLATALEYLHQKRIVYRDMKPSNVGFTPEGTLKLFDFGLAVCLPPNCDLDETHAYLEVVGTNQYMAPEVHRELAYNVKADVYGFTMQLWQLMKGQVKIKETVRCMNPIYGDRPSIPTTWPSTLTRVLQRGWSEDFQDTRPHMLEYRLILEDLLRIAEQEQGLDSLTQRNSRLESLPPWAVGGVTGVSDEFADD